MKLKRFISFHRRLIMIILSILIAISNVFLLQSYPDFSVILLIFLDLAFIIITSWLLYNCFTSLFSKPIAELNNKCDPYPLIEESEKHLNAHYSILDKFILLVNYSAALKASGQYQKALDILLSIDIEADAMKKLQHLKAAYYYRLMELCEFLNKGAQADFAYSKFLELIPQIKNERFKKSLEIEIVLGNVLGAFRKGDYQTVVETLESSVLNVFSSQITSSLTCAKAYLALGETEKAKEKLEYIIENGNKLHCVTEAREMLSSL